VVTARTARLVLEAVAGCLPPHGGDVITRIDLRNGWGGAVHVRVHTLLSRNDGSALGQKLRAAVADAVSGRHTLEIVWASLG
jgi:hypothetical protein